MHIPLTEDWSSSIRDGCPLWQRMQLQEGHTWNVERGKGHPPSQPDQLNQPWWSVGWQMSQPDHPHILQVFSNFLFHVIVYPLVFSIHVIFFFLLLLSVVYFYLYTVVVRKDVWNTFYPLHFMRPVFCPRMQSILENISHALKKNVYSGLFICNIL